MTEQLYYAIMRIGKIHNHGVLDAVEWHNTREGTARTVEGLPPPEEWTEMTGRYRDRADKILEETGATYEDTKILAVEVLVSASPEWWAIASENQKREWWKAQYAYAEHVFGLGLLAFTPHLDESSPHAQFLGLPLYHAIEKKKGAKPKDPEKLRKRLEEEANAPKIWRLSHDAVFGGGPEGLAERQTEYHGFVAHLGLTRGRNTVGLGIKNIPLKHYAKLLTQMDRDLARQADELAEDRQVLEHYNDELAQGFAEIKEHKELITKDELRLFAGQEELRVSEERLADGETELEQQRKAVTEAANRAEEAAQLIKDREVILTAKIAENERAKAALQAKIAEHDAKEILHTHAGTDLRLREEAADEREIAASAHEARNVKADAEIASKQSDLNKTLAQISILTGVMSGRLIMTWDGNSELRFAKGEPKPNEIAALGTPWPDPLRAPFRHALAMATKRKKLADKLRLILSRLRIKSKQAAEQTKAAANERRDALAEKSAARQASKDAQEKIRNATKSQEAANDAGKRAEQKQNLAENAQRVADARIAEAQKIEVSVTEKRAELTILNSDIATKEQLLTVVEGDIEMERTTLAELQHEGEALRTEQAKLSANKEALGKDVFDLEEKKARLTQDQAEIDAKRADFEADRKKWAYSVSVWKEAAVHGASVGVKYGRNVITVHNSDNLVEKVILANDVDQSVVELVRQKQALEKAMKEVEELAGNFDKQTKLLKERFPDEKKVLEEEREENKKSMQKLWASIQRDERGW